MQKMPDIPRALIVSSLAGRMRLRLPEHQHDAAFFRLLGQAVLMLPGVTASSTNALTAGVLIRFRGPPEALLAAAAKEGVFCADTPVSPLGQNSAAQLAPLGAAALALMAMLQAARGSILPPAATLIWYAASLILAAPRTKAGE